MQNLRNQLIAGGAVLLLAAIGTVMNRQAARADVPGPTVTIGAPLPLPVTGTVSVTGNVGINGTPNVHVANTLTAPVPTLDISKSASQHVELACINAMPLFPEGCFPTLGQGGVFTVPAGQNFMVTSVDFTGVGSFQLNSGIFQIAAWQVPNDATLIRSCIQAES